MLDPLFRSVPDSESPPNTNDDLKSFLYIAALFETVNLDTTRYMLCILLGWQDSLRAGSSCCVMPLVVKFIHDFLLRPYMILQDQPSSDAHGWSQH